LAPGTRRRLRPQAPGSVFFPRAVREAGLSSFLFDLSFLQPRPPVLPPFLRLSTRSRDSGYTHEKGTTPQWAAPRVWKTRVRACRVSQRLCPSIFLSTVKRIAKYIDQVTTPWGNNKK